MRVYIIGHSNNSYFVSLLLFANLSQFVLFVMLPHGCYGPSGILKCCSSIYIWVTIVLWYVVAAKFTKHRGLFCYHHIQCCTLVLKCWWRKNVVYILKSGLITLACYCTRERFQFPGKYACATATYMYMSYSTLTSDLWPARRPNDQRYN